MKDKPIHYGKNPMSVCIDPMIVSAANKSQTNLQRTMQHAIRQMMHNTAYHSIGTGKVAPTQLFMASEDESNKKRRSPESMILISMKNDIIRNENTEKDILKKVENLRRQLETAEKELQEAQQYTIVRRKIYETIAKEDYMTPAHMDSLAEGGLKATVKKE